MKRRRDSTGTEEENNVDFSFYWYSRKSKKNLVDQLEAVGAMTLLGLSKNIEVHSNTSDGAEDDNSDYHDDDDDSDYNNNDDDSDCNEEEEEEDHVLDEYFLSSDDFRTYGDPCLDYYQTDNSLTGTTVLKFQPMGLIRKKKISLRNKQVYQRDTC